MEFLISFHFFCPSVTKSAAATFFELLNAVLLDSMNSLASPARVTEKLRVYFQFIRAYCFQRITIMAKILHDIKS
jgi:hypothetical protein